MQRKIFMYLFLFCLLFIIYQYMNEKKIFENQDKKIEFLENKVASQSDSITTLNTSVADLNYFTLQGNENAMTYLESFGYRAKDVEELVTSQLMDQNLVNGDNPLVPFAGLEGAMKINKLKFLNNKWILADFTDGKYWGEMLVEYRIDDKKQLTLNTIASLLYPQ